MTDYGHELLFGAFLTPKAEDSERVVELARLADQVGLDLVGVQDHPYQPAFLETWTLLSVIAAKTTRLRVFPDVANLPLRPPGVLARAAASLDILSGGRVELGLGAGGFWDAIAAQGGPRRTPGEAIEALDEAIAVIRALWTPGRGVKLDGDHYSLKGAKPGPFPVHDIGIWLGAIKPRMLRLTGRAADGWLPSSPYVPPEQLAEANRIIDEAAAEAGRSPSAVRRLYNIGGTFTGDGFLQGPPKVWAEQLAELTLEEGMSGYIVMADSADIIRRYAAEVAPAVRELVAAERATATPKNAAPENRAALSGSGPGGSATAAATAQGPGPASPQARAAFTTATPTVHGPGSAGPEAREASTEETPKGRAATALAEPPPAAGALVIEPTPDDGVRLSDSRVWDESLRPTGPAPEAGRRYSARDQANAQELLDVHDHLRTELAQVRDLMEQVAAGTMDPAVARSHINTMTMRQNNWTLGTYCESYCRLVTMHHTAEDQLLFPRLRRSDRRLTPVIDRLTEEHHAIHGVIERVDRALVALVNNPKEGMADLRAAVDLLTDTLLSHLSYEERELIEPLARLGGR